MKPIKQFFSLLWRGWKKFAHVLGIVQTRILLTVAYFVILMIAAVVRIITRADLLDRKMDKRPTYYHVREPFKDTLQTVRRTF
jgi:hypothetical protein